MKIQLDTTNKTIKLEENVKLTKLMELVKKILPNNEWKEFTLETNTTITYWSNPVIIKEYPTYPTWEEPYIWMSVSENKHNCGNETLLADYSLRSGVYNLEVNDKLM